MFSAGVTAKQNGRARRRLELHAANQESEEQRQRLEDEGWGLPRELEQETTKGKP